MHKALLFVFAFLGGITNGFSYSRVDTDLYFRCPLKPPISYFGFTGNEQLNSLPTYLGSGEIMGRFKTYYFDKWKNGEFDKRNFCIWNSGSSETHCLDAKFKEKVTLFQSPDIEADAFEVGTLNVGFLFDVSHPVDFHFQAHPNGKSFAIWSYTPLLSNLGVNRDLGEAPLICVIKPNP